MYFIIYVIKKQHHRPNSKHLRRVTSVTGSPLKNMEHKTLEYYGKSRKRLKTIYCDADARC